MYPKKNNEGILVMKAGQKYVGHPVNVATGTLYSTYKEISIPGKVDLVWERNYSTDLLKNPPTLLGPGWTTRYFATLIQDKTDFRFHTPEGEIEIFVDPQGTIDQGGIIRNLSTFQELVKRDNRYIITRWDVDTGKIERYIFNEGKKGETWPLASIEDVTGQGLDLLYDTAGRLTCIQQRLEKRTLLLDYNKNNQINSILFLLPNNQRQVLASYEYDTNGRLCTAYNALGNADRYEYDKNSRMTREIVKDGGVFYFKYDEKGRCIKTSGLDRYDEKSFRYLDAAHWTEVTNSYSETTRYNYLPTGQVVREIDPLGGEKQTSYDEYGRIVAETNPNGAITRHEYDEQGNRYKVIDPNGYAYFFTVNNNHLTLKLTDPSGNSWERRYDSANRLVFMQDPLGSRWTIDYDQHGNAICVTSPTGAYKRNIFSANGLLIETTDWKGNPALFTYDHFGRLIERTGSLSETLKVRYDSLGHPIEITMPDGSTNCFTFDSGGNLATATDGNGHTAWYRYGPCHQLLEKTDRLGGKVHYQWGTEPNHLEILINETGDIYSFTYDAVGRVVREKAFDGREQIFQYDLAGRCVATINGNGEKITFSRDIVGNLLELQLPDGSKSFFQYDSSGNLISAVNDASEVRFDRDSLGRVLRETQGNLFVESRYDFLGNLVYTATNFGHETTYKVDANGMLAKLAMVGGESIEFLRNARGQEITRRMPGNFRLDQQFDQVGRLIEQRVSRGVLYPSNTLGIPTDKSLVHRRYAYDRSGAMKSLDDKRWGQVDYILDPVQRLLHAVRTRGVSEHFAYDSRGNMTSKVTSGAITTLNSLVYGPGNCLLEKDGTKYYYDKQGRLTRKIEVRPGAQDREWFYSWNALDQLSSLCTPEGELWRYSYDALGRRIAKTGPGKTVQYVWDRDVIVHEIEDQDYVSAWIFDPNSTIPLAKVQNGRLYCVIPDHHGTPSELLDVHGRIVWSAVYSIWGEADVKQDDGVDCAIRFQGQWYDAESGLHYNCFRYYDPQVGRFISPDPANLLGGLNTYAYCTNPIVGIDPLGLAEEHEIGTFGSLTGKKNAGDGLEAHEFIRNENLQQQGIGTGRRVPDNPSIALTPAQHDDVHAAEAAFRAQMGLGPNEFADIKNELLIMKLSLDAAGIPPDKIDELNKKAEKFAKEKGCQ